MAVVDVSEQFISTVDASTLRQLRWPFLRVFAPHYVERRELCRYERQLLATGLWSMVRVSPHDGSAGHLFDVYGVPRLRAW